MGEFVKLLLAWLPSPIRGLGAVVIASLAAILLRHDPSFSRALQDPFWRWIVLVALTGIGGLGTYPMAIGFAWCERKRSDKKLIGRLASLTGSEKHVLGRYLQDNSRTENWDRGGGTVDVLRRDGILAKIASVDKNTFSMVPDVYAINETVWTHLHAHPELIDLEPNQPSTPLER